MAVKKPKAPPPQKVICDSCDGNGCVWSEATLARWEEQTPWFDRVKMSPPPPHSWRDRTCEPCKGAGYFDLKTKEPLLDRLIGSAQRNELRRRRVQPTGG